MEECWGLPGGGGIAPQRRKQGRAGEKAPRMPTQRGHSGCQLSREPGLGVCHHQGSWTRRQVFPVMGHSGSSSACEGKRCSR